MKSQELLNQDYDKIMLDFKQKAFIDGGLNHEENLESFVSHVYSEFSNHFNNEYKHIYLKPLNDLRSENVFNSETKLSFSSVSKQFPLTFWNTTMGKEVAFHQAKLTISSIFALPVVEDKKLTLSTSTGEQLEDFSDLRELSKTDKIKIQENFTEFNESFLKSPILPESIKQQCADFMIKEIEFLIGTNQSKSYAVDFSKESDFVKEVFSTTNFTKPFEYLSNSKFIENLFEEKQFPSSV